MEGDLFTCQVQVFLHISIHSLRMEGDLRLKPCKICGGISIHSLRMEGDCVQDSVANDCRHFNPLPPHGGRQVAIIKDFDQAIISIHSLRMEGDLFSVPHQVRRCYFNPLPPHGGRRYVHGAIMEDGTFQSTPSAWRETSRLEIYRQTKNISIHSLRMEGDAVLGV